MTLIRGVDGGKRGWVVITADLDSGNIRWDLYRDSQQLVHARPMAVVTAIDIPIGLPERGPRACDRAARQLLGRPRGSSVFPAPLRPLLGARDYAEACAMRQSIDGKKISLQTWHIMDKIRDLDAVLHQDTALQQRVREVHPEVSFFFLAGGRPMVANKKTAQGRHERRTLLLPHFGPAIDQALSECRRLESAADDVLDAFAALWTARRIAAGRSLSLPPDPQHDRVGLRMEILA